MEIWKDIKNYEGYYQISNLGNVRAIKKWHPIKKIFMDDIKLLKPFDNGNGYLVISLASGGTKRKNFYIHRLVASTFIPNPNLYPQVNHIDFNKKNNAVDNLEWCTPAQNTRHSSANMHKPRKNPPKTNTGERFITYRKTNKSYRVIIREKEYAAPKTLEEAINIRNKILEETGYVKVDSLRY